MTKEKTRKVLVVAFSGVDAYGKDNLKKCLSDNDEIVLCSAYDFVYNDWFSPLRLLKKRLTCFRKKKKPKATWASSKSLKRYMKSEIGYTAKIVKPNILDILRWFFVSLHWALANYALVEKQAKGEIVSIDVQGIESSGYIMDSMQRWVNNFYIEKETGLRSKVEIIFTLFKMSLYGAWFCNILDKYKFEKVLVNHNVYFESGWMAECLRLKSKAMVVHIMRQQVSPFEISCSREPWTKQMIKSELKNEALMQDYEVENDIYWYDETSLSDIKNIYSGIIDKSYILVVMHAFTDANNVHGLAGGEIYPTFYSWIKDTLEIARHNQDIKYIFRMHPNTKKYYKKDFNIINMLFKSAADCPNILFEDPEHESCRHFDDSFPIAVTFRGTIALETALVGYKTITIGDPSAPEGSYYKVDSRKQYKKILTGLIDGDELLVESCKIREARTWKNVLSNCLVK